MSPGRGGGRVGLSHPFARMVPETDFPIPTHLGPATTGPRATGNRYMHDIRNALDVLLAVDPTHCDHTALDRLTSATQRLRSFTAAAEARIAQRRHELVTGAASPIGVEPPPDDRPGTGPPGTSPPGESPGESADGAAAPGLDDRTRDLLDALPCSGDRRSGRSTDQARIRGRITALLPMFDLALSTGRIDPEHLDAVAAAWATIVEPEPQATFLGHADQLLDRALAMRPERFRSWCRDLARRVLHDHGVALLERQRRASTMSRWVDRSTGMWNLRLAVDPERGAMIDAAIEHGVQRRRTMEPTGGQTFTELEIDTVVALLTSQAVIGGRDGGADGSGGDGSDAAPRGSGSTRPLPEISVIIDLETLTTGVFGAGSVCETSGLGGTPLPPATVRRLACDASVIPVVLGATSVPVDVGRSARLATEAQRRSLRAIHPTCAHPDCTRAFDRCRIHHVVPWERGGRSDLANLLPLCLEHHQLVHEGGWSLTLDEDRWSTWRRPDGTVWFEGPLHQVRERETAMTA